MFCKICETVLFNDWFVAAMTGLVVGVSPLVSESVSQLISQLVG